MGCGFKCKLRRFLIETFVIRDSIFYDDGYSGTAVWTIVPNSLDLTRYTDYTNLKWKTGVSSFGYLSKSIPFDDYVMEWDFQLENISDASLSLLDMRNNDGTAMNITKITSRINDSNWHHIKLVIDSQDMTYYWYVDDVLARENTLSREFDRFQFNARGENSLNFKNFCIYPI